MGKHQVFKLTSLPPGQSRRKLRRQNRQRFRRSRAGRTPRRDIGPAAPPALSMMSNTCSLWLRTVEKKTFKEPATGKPAKTNDAWTPTIIQLIGNPWTSLAEIFAEIKVLRVNVYLYTRNTNLSSVGIHTLAVTDKGEIYDTKRDFISVSSMPGASTRRVTQPLHGSWFPTEPTDRDWTLFNGDTSYLDVTYAVDGVSLPLDFDLFYDVHCRFRGLKHAPSTIDFRSEMRLATSISDVCIISGSSSVDVIPNVE